MRVLISFTIILSLSVLSLAFVAERINDNYVDVHDMNTLSPLAQLPPQDPAIHSLPTVPTVPLVPTCMEEGYFRDPFNCKKFYYCLDAEAVPAAFYCQPGLIFNTVTNTCVNSEYVDC